MPSFRERVRRFGQWMHEHCNWDTSEEEEEKRLVHTTLLAIQHGRMGIEHMPKRRKTEPTAEENGASSAASDANPPPSSAASGAKPPPLPSPGVVSGPQPQTHSPARLSNDAHENALSNIEQVSFNCSAAKQSAAGGQAVPVVYEGATLANVKGLLSASEAGVFDSGLMGFLVDKGTQDRLVGDFELVRAKKERGVFSFQFTFKLHQPADGEPIVLEHWFSWDEVAYVLTLDNLGNDHSAQQFCFVSLGVQ